MKLRNWSIRRWALIVAAIIVLPLIGLRLHLKWQVHRAVAELQEAGKPVTWADLNQLYNQPVPELENAFNALTNAYAKLSQPNETERDLIPVVGRFTEQRFAPLDWPENVRLATSGYLERQREGLDESVTALQRPVYRNPWVLGQPGYDRNKIVHPKNVVSLLHLQARYSMLTGNWREAARSIEAQLRFAEHLAGSPELLTHFVRFAFIAMATRNIELLLGVTEADQPQLTQLRQAIQAAAAQSRFDHVVVAARVRYLEPIYWRTSAMPLTFDFDQVLNYQEQRLWKQWWMSLQPMLYRMSGLADRDLLYLLESSHELETASSSLERTAELTAKWMQSQPSGYPRLYWSEMILPSQAKAVQKWIEGYTRLRAADAALAVAQYRLQHDGKLPGSLDQLVPEFLDAVPVEPQSDKPFELIVTADGYGIGRGTPVFTMKVKQP